MTSTASTTTDLPGGFRATFSLSGYVLTCEWEPDVPTRAQFEQLRQHYLFARDAFLATQVADVFIVHPSLGEVVGHA